MNGEIKPGLRTAAAHRGTLSADGINWRNLPNLIPPAGQDVQEGVAGVSTGYSNGALLVAGGANFPGSTAKFAAGTLYAHEGLTKTWHSDVCALRAGRWSIVGQLPQVQGYGTSIQNGDEVILVGDELLGGTPSSKVFSPKLSGNKVILKD